MRRLLILLVVLVGALDTRAFARCTLAQLGQFPINMVGLRPTLTAQINGNDVVFVVDSGAFWSILSPATARQLHLGLGPPPFGLTVNGVTGRMDYQTATVKLGFGALHERMEFIVGGNELGVAQGLLGQNILRAADVDYDLANGVIRWMKPSGCGKAGLAYWAKDKPFSAIEIQPTTAQSPSAQGIAYLNGKRIHVLFDTGAYQSLLSLQAAERAGVKPGDAGVREAGYSGGLGTTLAHTWIGNFDSFKIGDEEIRHTQLRFVDQTFDGFDMLIGADFFLAHHVYVANSQDRLYFTYNGGPVFNLMASLPKSDGGNTAPPSSPTAPSPAAAVSDQPTDAVSFARRGAGLAARGELIQALADFTRASQLDPTNGSYFAQRGLVEMRLSEPQQALADVDQALTLQPDATPARLARVQLSMRLRDRDGVRSDLQALDSGLPKEADERALLGTAYLWLEDYPAVVRQDELWLDAHREDIEAPAVLNQSCWARALAGQELPEALRDCDAAVRRAPAVELRAAALDSRGLVRLRMGDYKCSINDYDAALKIRPKIAASLYGRGIDEQRQGKASAAQMDLQAAVTLQPTIVDLFRRMGVTP